MSSMKYVLHLAQNYRAKELENKILAAEAYNDNTVTFDGEILSIQRAKGMYLIIKQVQDLDANANLDD